MPYESSTINPEAVDYLNNIEAQKEEQSRQIAVEGAKMDAHSFCINWLTKAKDWRRASYEEKWLKYQNNADGVFDKNVAQAKSDWQSKVHVNVTASHRETIHAHLYRTICGVKPPLEIKARFDLGDIDQSDNIRDIILREMDKSRWETEFNKILEDSTTYGSGFIRVGYKSEKATRAIRRPIRESWQDNAVADLPSFAYRAATNNLKIMGYQESEEEIQVYRGLELRHLSIWDIFPDPKALKIFNSPIAYRYKLTYGELIDGIRQGYYYAETADKLKGISDEDTYKQGEDEVQSDREVQDSKTDKTQYSNVLECYEHFVKLPQKWVYGANGMDVEDPEALVPCRVIFHKDCILAIEKNMEYDGEAPIYKMDYMPLNMSFYGRGIPEMLLDSQAVINDVVNQRLDYGAMSLNHSFAVIERALVNPKQDLEQKPGMMIRIDGNKAANGVSGAIMPINLPDTPVRAGFSEVNEAERWAQERTSANRVTLGTSGLVKDANQTLGGQQMLRESAGEKFSFIGLHMEVSFLQDFFKAIWKVVYQNLTPEDIENAIGPERAKTFILVAPEEMDDYIYTPLGVFTMENKAMRQARILQLRQSFLGAPWLDDEKFFDAAAQTADEDPEKFKKDEQQILEEQAQMIQPGGQPEVDLTGAPMEPMPPVPGPTARAPEPMSPEDIKAAYKSGGMTRDMAVNMLRQQHGME